MFIHSSGMPAWGRMPITEKPQSHRQAVGEAGRRRGDYSLHAKGTHVWDQHTVTAQSFNSLCALKNPELCEATWKQAEFKKWLSASSKVSILNKKSTHSYSDWQTFSYCSSCTIFHLATLHGLRKYTVGSPKVIRI